MLYEDPNQPVDSKERFHIELHFSPGEKINKEYNNSDDDSDSEDDLDEKHNPDSEATTIRENSENQIQENTVLFEKSTEKSSIDPMEPDRDGHYSSIPVTSRSNLEDGSSSNLESESFLTPVNSSRLEKFMKSAQMHKSAPPGGNSGQQGNVGFTVGTPPVDSINEVPSRDEDSGNNLERVYSGKSDTSNQRAFDWNQLVGLGTADGNPMFSHKIINGETYETEELMNLTKPNVTKPIPRTHSAGKLTSYNSRGTVSAPDISFKNANSDMETAKNIITDVTCANLASERNFGYEDIKNSAVFAVRSKNQEKRGSRSRKITENSECETVSTSTVHHLESTSYCRRVSGSGKTNTSGCKLRSQMSKHSLEYYSMVTSISPLETLHNSLTLEQMDTFLGKMIEADTLGGNAGSSV